MQINRLFEIVYVLLNKKTTTAKELSERFEVSARTIYRDVETLSMAGIPIYTNKGKGGGISLAEGFVLNKSILSEKEQNEVLMSLQSLASVEYSAIDPLLTKLSTFFKRTGTSWIEIDFSRWGSDGKEQEKFEILKTAIFNNLFVKFEYYSSYGEKTERMVAPMKLVFRGQSWYMYGFCQGKEDYRFFKISRMKVLEKTDIVGSPRTEQQPDIQQGFKPEKTICFLLKIEAGLAYRVFDEFDESMIEKNEDGSFLVKAELPESDWIYGYIMSFGDQVEIMEPLSAREIIKRKYQEGLNRYQL